jgi:hypothetical protein
MKIKWFAPLDQFFGPVSEVLLAEPTPLPQVLRQLTEQEPGLAPYTRFGEGDRQAHGLLVCRRGLVLSLTDELEPDDELEMVVMVTGG